MSSSSTPADAPAAGRIERHVWRIAIVVILGSIMAILDTTIVNVALETLSEDLDAPLDDIQWIVTGYMLALAAVIPISGWLATRYTARRMYLSSLIVFTLGSVLCGLAWSTESLVVARVIQGVGGGLLAPVGQMILVRAAGPRNLPRIMSAIGVPMILAPVFGPTLGGLLIEHVGWQWIFFVNLPIGVLTLFAALKLLPRDAAGDAGKLDAPGLALAATGVVAVTFGLAESGHAGTLTAPEVLIPFLAGLLLIAIFVMRALRIPQPLLDMRLYANRAFAAASATSLCLGAALFGAMILMPLYFQTVRGEDAVATGLLLIPQGVGAAFAMGLSGRATERWGGGLTALLGGAITIVTTLPFVAIGAETSYWLLGVAMFARGFGIGMSMMPSMTAAFTVLRPDQISHATPQLNVVQRIGGSIGTAILTIVLSSNIEAAGALPTPVGLADAFGSTYVIVLVVSAVAMLPTALLALVERHARRAGAQRGPAPVVAETEVEVAA